MLRVSRLCIFIVALFCFSAAFTDAQSTCTYYPDGTDTEGESVVCSGVYDECCGESCPTTASDACCAYNSSGDDNYCNDNAWVGVVFIIILCCCCCVCIAGIVGGIVLATRPKKGTVMVQNPNGGYPQGYNNQMVNSVSYPTNQQQPQQPQQPQAGQQQKPIGAPPAYVDFSPAINAALFNSGGQDDNDGPPKPAIPNTVY